MVNRAGVFLSIALIFSGVQSHAYAPLCVELFGTSTKYNYVDEAYEIAKIEKPSKEILDPIVAKWNMEKATDWKLELLAQKMIQVQMNLDGNFFARLKNIFWGRSNKKYFQLRSRTLALKQALVAQLAQDNKLQPDTIWDHSRRVYQYNKNSIKIAKAVIINYYAMKWLGTPIYWPALDFASKINLSDEDLALIENLGEEKAYDVLKTKFKIPFAIETIYNKTPRLFYAVIPLVATFNFYYMKLDQPTITEEPTVSIPVDIIPQTNPIYLDWAKKYQETFGRSPDLKNISDLTSWEQVEFPLYLSFTKAFSRHHGRQPDPKNSADLAEWYSYLTAPTSY